MFYNLILSQKRADTIRNYLINEGVDKNLITAKGFGESDSIIECENKISRSELINCLKPNRRIEVEVNGYGELN